MTDRKSNKARNQAEFRAQLMQGMSEEGRARFLRHMEIGDKIMNENREILKKLADS